MKFTIIIPAYNEEKRIAKTLQKYGQFFSEVMQKNHITVEILVSLNGCKDNTLEIVQQYAKQYAIIRYINLPGSGKGLALIEGFKDALTRNLDFVGFVDADMATTPEVFYDLIQQLGTYDG